MPWQSSVPFDAENYATQYRVARDAYLIAADDFDDAAKLYKITSAILRAYLASTPTQE